MCQVFQNTHIDLKKSSIFESHFTCILSNPLILDENLLIEEIVLFHSIIVSIFTVRLTCQYKYYTYYHHFIPEDFHHLSSARILLQPELEDLSKPFFCLQ